MKVCCVETALLPAYIREKTAAFTENIFDIIPDNAVCWIERKQAEHDVHYRQLIPYVLLRRHDGKIACYPRHGTETRLHGLYSCGIGGHIDETDRAISLRDTVRNGLCRELSEELSGYCEKKIMVSYRGIINEVQTETGLVHLGIVYRADCLDGYIPQPAAELSGMEWLSAAELKTVRWELWSELALPLANQ